ncbi:hypothetical protein L1987_64805 [Smallanthus sonchifolius]|uniref:Uncharacterized protein n=1 Tax=Smallanthus sonchifolius TaxID=185202 RepID=A0ACB9BSR1_9ASTR|nr:hypothetical protein L1987_64805 [Smallanthus sonchifolius]
MQLANTFHRKIVSLPTSGCRGGCWGGCGCGCHGGNIPCGQVLRAIGRDLRPGACAAIGSSAFRRMFKLLDTDVLRLLLECSEGSSVSLFAEFSWDRAVDISKNINTCV